MDEAFAGGLRELGWVQGKNLLIDWRQATRAEELFAYAAELARLRPDVVVTAGPQATQAMAEIAPTVPVVFLAVADPVKLGLVRSLAHPGGNVTGFATIAGDGYAGKLLELLKEAAPRTSRVGLLTVAGNAMHRGFEKHSEKSAAQRDLGVVVLRLNGERDIEPAFDSARREGVQALVVPGDVLVSTHQDRIAALALRHRLPTMFMFSSYVQAGGLLAYGVNVAGLFRDAARQTDKILRGTHPRDIPVEQPTRFDLAINLRTAKQLGLKIPDSLRIQATKVIE